MILLAIYCGLRYSEIVGLTKTTLVFNTISINKTWKYMKSTGIGFGKTKNETSIRTIKIDKKLMNTFKKFYLSQLQISMI